MEEVGIEIEKKISVPNRLIKNNELDCTTFGLYVYILMQNQNRLHKTIHPQQIIDEFNWSKTDTRTIKKHLNLLYKFNAIDTEFKKMSLNHHLSFNIVPIQKGELYTMVENHILNKIKKCTKNISFITKDRNTKEKTSEYEFKNLQSNGVRLYFYYKMTYIAKLGYSQKEFKDITYDTKMSAGTVRALNIELSRNKLIYIEEGMWKTKQIDGYSTTQKSRNKYIPVCEKDEGKNKKKKENILGF